MYKLSQRFIFAFSKQKGYYGSMQLGSTSSTFKASELIKNIRKDQLPLPEFSAQKLAFGKFSTDHIINIAYSKDKGWEKPVLKPFEMLQMHPFNTAIHYAVQCFEGMKAYRNEKGEIRLFRPQCNAFRFKHSSTRITLPDFDGNELVKVIQEYVKAEERWIPPFSEFSLYLRPLHISMDEALGVKSPDNSQIMVMAAPVGPYYPTGFKPISLFCSTEVIRSSPKGTGAFKIGGNYAPTLKATRQAGSSGHQQILWLHNDQIVEVGSSNIFFIFKDKDGQIQIATPELEDLVLPGVTRDTIIKMLKMEKKYKMAVRRISIHEIKERSKNGELLECFGAGTAVILSPVSNIQFEGHQINIPVDQKLGCGPISYQIRKNVLDIQEGRAEDKYGWVKRIK